MNHQNGFTLIELLLVVVVLMIFMASAVFYMSPALRRVQLEEGAARFEHVQVCQCGSDSDGAAGAREIYFGE